MSCPHKQEKSNGPPYPLTFSNKTWFWAQGPEMGGFWFRLQIPAALLSASRKWPRDGVLLIPTTVSVLNLEHSEKNHVLDFKRFFLSLKEFVLPPLIDLLESSKMLEMPNRFPSVMLLSLKKDPVDCNVPTKRIEETKKKRENQQIICREMIEVSGTHLRELVFVTKIWLLEISKSFDKILNTRF